VLTNLIPGIFVPGSRIKNHSDAAGSTKKEEVRQRFKRTFSLKQGGEE
jgi:hypothetical protein